MATRYPYPLPTHSNPNLPHNCLDGTMIQRSSSHPPDMFCWEPVEPQAKLTQVVDKDTQTTAPADLIEQFILQNPHRVLIILGLNPELILRDSDSSRRCKVLNIPQTESENNLKNCNPVLDSVHPRQEWNIQPLPAPSFRNRQKTNVPHQQRFSAGDIDDGMIFPAISPKNSTNSLKFHFFDS